MEGRASRPSLGRGRPTLHHFLNALHPSHHVRDERALAIGIGHAIICMSRHQGKLQALIFARHVRMLDEVIAEQQPIPATLSL